MSARNAVARPEKILERARVVSATYARGFLATYCAVSRVATRPESMSLRLMDPIGKLINAHQLFGFFEHSTGATSGDHGSPRHGACYPEIIGNTTVSAQAKAVALATAPIAGCPVAR